MTTAKRTKWGDGGVECNLCRNDAMYVGLCAGCSKARREAKPCGECGLEATHSITCPYFLRLKEIYGAARSLLYAGTPMGTEVSEARLKRALELQIEAEAVSDKAQRAG